jgi:hypothetical protein
MTALPFPLHYRLAHPMSQFRNQAAMNKQLFRYLKVEQLQQNAITVEKITWLIRALSDAAFFLTPKGQVNT